MLSHSVVSDSSWSQVAHQAPLSMRILQTRIVEWVAKPSSRGSSQLRDQTQASISGRFFTIWATGKPGWSCGFNLHFVQLMERFWILFLSHTAPGFQLWFHLHLCMWVIPRGLLLRLPRRTWAFPSEGQVWGCCNCLGRKGPGSTTYSGMLVAREAGNMVFRSV